MSGYRHDSDVINAMDWFCGAGGSSQGIDAVPGVRVTRAANHWDPAIESHALNFPHADHWKGDIRQAPVEKWPVAQVFWASPECPKWTNARGKKRDFDTAQEELPGFEKPRDPADERSRALMEEVPMYLRGVQERGGLVLAGIVENVIDCRAWIEWDRWLGELHKLGYATKTIALNSMHAQPRTLLRAPQSRDRLYVAYWHRSLGRTPDWNKWLRPTAWCSGCEQVVRAMQVFKKPGADMGRYGIRSGQYVYRCPSTSCRNQIVEPEVLPALAAIDWTIPGTPIGDRPRTADAPEGLKPKTIARIRAGLERFSQPVMVPSGGTWRDAATPVAAPMPTRTTRENDALAVPPLLIPSEGRDGKEASPAHRPLRTQTARNETGLAWLPPGVFEPFVTPVRGGGDSERARPLSVPLHAVTAGGNHHGLVTPPGISGEDLQTLLVPYYGNGNAVPATSPVGAFTTRDRWALVQSLADIDIQDVLYRMLEPHEIGRGMAFADDYQLAARSKRDRVRLLGNAVTPPVAEILVSALAEAITGTELELTA
ncbi:DNA cytosine methyltransferase [Streptomyces sp. BR123]|uniref:DNA cytosine methyltransferase n=1 Tax=Streptomyces sp. BR123 TaxID=2749828 RepID=UPI002810E392|nr:DNA cytosine methyltransferase [Streptomyces sp. BR123]